MILTYEQVNTQQIADHAVAAKHHDHANSSTQYQALHEVCVLRRVGLRRLQPQSCSRHHAYAQELQRLLANRLRYIYVPELTMYTRLDSRPAYLIVL